MTPATSMDFSAKTITLALGLGVSTIPPVLLADRIFLIGDSWGWRRQASLTQVIVHDHGFSDVIVSAPPKILFSSELASTSGLATLTNLMEGYPDTIVVHLSMGGNELSITPDQVGTEHEAQVHAAIIQNVETAIDHIWAIRPNMQILWSGYDYFRPKFFPTPAEYNEIHMRFGEACARFADAKGPLLTYNNQFGVLQLAFGFSGEQLSEYDPPFAIPPRDPSLPDPQWPSPYEAYADSGDPEHPNEAGWEALAEAEYVSFYGPLLGDEGFEINAGLNGNWWKGPEREGEGVQLEIAQAGDGTPIVVMTFYSYDPSGNQIFLVAVGPVEGNTAELEVFITGGGIWGQDFDPAQVDETSWGTGRLTADSCESIHLALMPDEGHRDLGYANLEYALVRLTSSLITCP